MDSKITSEDIVGMINHWLSVQPNGYHGSPYGADLKSLLQVPQSDPVADEFIRKMYVDIPILNNLPRGSVNLYFEDIGNDKKNFIIEVVGQQIRIPA